MNEPKEVTAYWKWLKQFGTEDDRKRNRPMYLYIQKLQSENAKLAKQLDEFMAPQMFAKKPLTHAEALKIKAIEETIRVSMARGKEEHKGENLKTRLRRMILDKQTESAEWGRMLKYNQLTEDEARKLAGNLDV